MALIILGFAPTGNTLLLIIGYYLLMVMSGAPNNLMPSQYLTMSGGGVSFMIFNSFALAIASVLRSLATSVVAFSTSNFEGSYMPALVIFLIGAVLAVILINVGGYKTLKKEI